MRASSSCSPTSQATLLRAPSAAGGSTEHGHGALSELEAGPDVHVDDDRDDLQHHGLLEVHSQAVVVLLKCLPHCGVGGASEGFCKLERGALGIAEEPRLPPRAEN